MSETQQTDSEQNSTDIELGDVTRDTITGFEGVVKSISYHITGCTRVELQGAGKPNVPGEAEFFYIDEVESTDEPESELGTVDVDVTTEVDFELGEYVSDTVTDMEGVAIIIAFELFNCPRIYVQPTDDVDGGKFIDAPRLETVHDGVSDQFDGLDDEATADTGAVSDLTRTTDLR